MNRVAKLATDLLDRYGIKSVPVSLEPLLEDNRIVVTNWSFSPPYIGMSGRGKHKNFIAVQRGLSCESRRRVIGHEGAHVGLHAGNHFYMSNSPLQKVLVDKQEFQAETFAAYYLIPEWELERVRYLRIDELADHFLVPEDLARFRLYLKQGVNGNSVH